MPPKHHKPSPSSSQSISHLEQLTTRFSDTSIQSFAGAISGVATSVVICPLEVIKIKLQGRDCLQLWTLDLISKRRSFQDRGLIGTGRAIWLEGGLIGMPTTDVGILKCVRSYWRYLFHITHKSIVGYQDQTHFSIKYLYKHRSERIQVCHRRRLEDRYLTGAGLGNWHEDHGWLQVLGILAASSASKACAIAATYPHEVIRTRLQTQQKIYPFTPVEPARPSKTLDPSVRGSGPRREKCCDGGRTCERLPLRYQGIISTFKTILREEGWRALYSGMGTGLIGAVPASATTMLVYETVVRVLKKSRMQGKRKLELQDATGQSGSP
ncbi:mitochondrial carrier domain-containing protein [Fusarium solani]|uniref:Mitochondrial carrier domain-containing protein n=1 Tax=Fusarium solani TaxID=169388 RepID=A0A9P9KCR7_FUSSL|nr:mitochondrial carrier domain-containing protein [Fusarium solani]KAH7248264.1 mitochondrial carrier domain-containing protein [Fusarium solani]